MLYKRDHEDELPKCKSELLYIYENVMDFSLKRHSEFKQGGEG